jgi:hypothetical protein
MLNPISRIGLPMLLAALILACAFPIATSASWGKKYDNGERCSQGNGHHCYAIAEWEMTGVEKVEGTLAYQYTTTMNVPGWATGDFVDNEEWAAFLPSGYWIEVGQTAGEYMDCCSLHPFYAWMNGSGYSQYIAPWTWPASENNLYQLSGQSHDGHWCAYFASTQALCVGGFPAWSNDLQVGLEIAANTKPANAGHESTNAWWESKTHNWLKEYAYADGGTCLSRYPYPYPALGNIYFGTC